MLMTVLFACHHPQSKNRSHVRALVCKIIVPSPIPFSSGVQTGDVRRQARVAPGRLVQSRLVAS